MNLYASGKAIREGPLLTYDPDLVGLKRKKKPLLVNACHIVHASTKVGSYAFTFKSVPLFSNIPLCNLSFVQSFCYISKYRYYKGWNK